MLTTTAKLKSAASADAGNESFDDGEDEYITASEGGRSDDEEGVEHVEEDVEKTPVPQRASEKGALHTPTHRKREASRSPDGDAPAGKQFKQFGVPPVSPTSTLPLDAAWDDGENDGDAEDEDDDIDEILDGNIIASIYQDCVDNGQRHVSLQASYDEHPEWQDFYTYSAIVALLGTDPRFRIAGEDPNHTVSLDTEILECYQDPDDESELAKGLDDLDFFSSDDDDDDDSGDEESDCGSTFEDSIAIEDPLDLFAKVKSALKLNTNLQDVEAKLGRMMAVASLENWLDETQHSEFKILCEEAQKRVKWSEKPMLKQGHKGFNDFADIVLNSEQAELVGEDFKMQPINHRLLKCSKCNKERDVGAGPQYFAHTESKSWECAEDDGGCDVPEAPIDKVLNLQPYQKTVEYLAHPFSRVQRLLVAHRTGAGKTITMVRILDNYFYDPRPKIVILPTRSTVVNFYRELLRTPNRFVDFARACAADADHRGGANGAALMDSTDDADWEDQLQHMCTVFKMRRFFQKGIPNEKRRAEWLKNHKGVPMPSAPIVVLSYARAGGRSVENRSLYEFRIQGKNRGGEFGDGGNPYNDKIVLCDEVHNLTMPKPQFQRYSEKFKFLERHLKEAKGTSLFGLTATPVKEHPKDAKALLDVIKGDVSGRKLLDEGFVSYFGANPPSLFPKSEPIGMPSYSLPEAILVPMTLQMRKKYLTKKDATFKRLVNQQGALTAENAAKLRATLAGYCNMQTYFARTHIDVQSHRRLGSGGYLDGVLGALSPTLAAKLDKIAEDVIKDWVSSDDSNNKSIILIDRRCGFEALFLLLRRKAADRGGSSLQPSCIKSFPSVSNKKTEYLESDPAEAPLSSTSILDKFNHPSNSDGSKISVLVVDALEAAEGISFKAVRTMYMANPPSSWLNYQQLAGRSVRAFSHNALAAEHRVVKSKMYVGTLPQHAASCNQCMASCNGETGEAWFCSKCSLFFCSKECKKAGHTSCDRKPKKMMKSGLEAIKTADEELMDDLQVKLANEPPLRKLELVAVDRRALLQVNEIEEHATAFAKIVREAKIRKINKRKRIKEEKEAREAKEQTEKELKETIDKLQDQVKAQDATLTESRADISLDAGRCFTCTETLQVIKCKKGHAMCVECFDFQFEEKCNDSVSNLAIMGEIACIYHGCNEGWTFEDALKYVSKKHHEKLRSLYRDCRGEQLARMKHEMSDLQAKRLELATAIAVKCPEYWTERKSIPKDLSSIKEPFSEIDVTYDTPFGDAITMKRQVQAIINGLCIGGALGKGVDQKEKQSYSKMEVQKVLRVENPFLWMRYQSTTVNLRATREMLAAMGRQPKLVPVRTVSLCEKLMRNNKLRGQLQEVYLFHG